MPDSEKESKWLPAFKKCLEPGESADETIGDGFPVTVDGVLWEMHTDDPNRPYSMLGMSDELKAELIRLVEKFCHDRDYTWNSPYQDKDGLELPYIVHIDMPGSDSGTDLEDE